MHNFYLIYGEEEYLIKKEIENIVKEKNIEEEGIIKYNLNEQSINEVIEEASMVGLFSSNKLIICDNCYFLTSEKQKDNKEDLLELEKYIDKPFDDVTIVFIVKEEKLDERKKIVKSLKKVSSVIECNSLQSHDLYNYINNYFKENGYKIEISLVRLLVDKVKYDLSNIINECDKLMLYKDEDKVIKKEDIDNLIRENFQDNVFELTNAILEKNIEKKIKIYKDLLLLGEEPIKLIVMVSNQFRLLLQVKLMVKHGYKQIDMANIIKEHPYRIKLALNSNYSQKEIIDNLKKLYQLDYDIKNGIIDKNFGFELYLLS